MNSIWCLAGIAAAIAPQACLGHPAWMLQKATYQHAGIKHQTYQHAGIKSQLTEQDNVSTCAGCTFGLLESAMHDLQNS